MGSKEIHEATDRFRKFQAVEKCLKMIEEGDVRFERRSPRKPQGQKWIRLENVLKYEMILDKNVWLDMDQILKIEAYRLAVGYHDPEFTWEKFAAKLQRFPIILQNDWKRDYQKRVTEALETLLKDTLDQFHPEGRNYRPELVTVECEGYGLGCLRRENCKCG